MTITIYADFSSPLSFLASQRMDRVNALGTGRVRWCAVEADLSAPVTGRRLERSAAVALAAATAELALPGEQQPAIPAVLSHPGALTAAYAEAVTDGLADELRRAAMDALWLQGRTLSDAEDVRRLLAAVGDTAAGRVARPAPAEARSRRPDRLLVALGDPDPMVGSRALAGTITRVGGPVSAGGQARLERWRAGWVARGRLPLPLVVTDLGEALPGALGLDFLSRRLPETVLVIAPRDLAAPAAPSRRPEPVLTGGSVR